MDALRGWHTSLPNGGGGLVAQSCPALCDPVDCSSPGSSVHRIFQARILGWVAISFSSGTSPRRDHTQVYTAGSLPHCRRITDKTIPSPGWDVVIPWMSQFWSWYLHLNTRF